MIRCFSIHRIQIVTKQINLQKSKCVESVFALFKQTGRTELFPFRPFFCSKGSNDLVCFSGDGWHSFMEDQLALLDHLGVENCLLLGGRRSWELGLPVDVELPTAMVN